MRNTTPLAYTAVPTVVTGCSGHVAGIHPVTFAGTSVTFPESPVTLDRNTQQYAEMLTLMRLGNPSLRVVLGLALFAEALQTSNSHLPTSELEDKLDIPLKQSLLASLCGVSRGVFSECVQQLAAEGWVQLNYATLALSRLNVWRKFSSQYRHNRHNSAKPSIQEVLSMMGEAAVS